MRKLAFVIAICLLPALVWTGTAVVTQGPVISTDLDRKVQKFLDSRRGTWHDMNVPVSDGRVLYDIVAEHKYRSALEIGTSTGHSGIWISWALSKTGGRLVTVEIDKARHDEAVANFREAGLIDFIEARLGDAHAVVPALNGPFDFVFSDADKEWYKNYLAAVVPKLSVGGCFVAHNVSEDLGGYSREFLQYARSLPFLETTVTGHGMSGMSVSYRRAGR